MDKNNCFRTKPQSTLTQPEYPYLRIMTKCPCVTRFDEPNIIHLCVKYLRLFTDSNVCWCYRLNRKKKHERACLKLQEQNPSLFLNQRQPKTEETRRVAPRRQVRQWSLYLIHFLKLHLRWHGTRMKGFFKSSSSLCLCTRGLSGV